MSDPNKNYYPALEINSSKITLSCVYYLIPLLFLVFTVIPKFEVIINPPSYLLINSKTVDVEICAK